MGSEEKLDRIKLEKREHDELAPYAFFYQKIRKEESMTLMRANQNIDPNF
ncbi:MAG: hypothetical protein U9Q68_00665 [Euryarchaeota archaeon]|nr:hypothetical protein [Euryarchaeota archaeon]